jgi:beta-glucosidase
MQQIFLTNKTTLAIAIGLAFTAGLVACGGGGGSAEAPVVTSDPVIVARAKGILTVDNKQFKDLNGNGKLDPYEDWRLSVDARASDLVARMSTKQKAGMMLIDTLGPGCGGTYTSTATDYITVQMMTRFILRQTASPTGTTDCSATSFTTNPQQLAQFTNAIQELAEAQPLGIPVVFKDNARNHYNSDPRFGISGAAGAFTQFPREAGLAAAALGEESLKTGKTPTTGDMSIIDTFTSVMAKEYNAVGLRGMYGYMADLATEPRWYRVSEVFTESSDLNANIMTSLVKGLQGGPVSSKTAVAMTMKHFPGGGPQELGLDPHYSYGKRQVYPGGNFAAHIKPFKAAIDAGLGAVMPYYGVPINASYDGLTLPQTGFAFSKVAITDLLRGKLGFTGYVNSDTGIINDRAWGLEDKTVPERVAAAINGGTETLSGFHTNSTVTDLITANLISAARVDEAVKRLLAEQFKLGLFENPYIDTSKANATVGNSDNLAAGQLVMKKSIVLLQNQDVGAGTKVLPLKAGAKLYTVGMGKADVEKYGYTVTDGNTVSGVRPPVPAGTDYAVIRVIVADARLSYGSKDPATGANPAYLSPITGKVWGSEDGCVMFPAINATCTDNGNNFGGAVPWEYDILSITGMAASKSKVMTPTLAELKAITSEIGDPKKVVLAVYFRNPYVLDDASGMKSAGALLATFGVNDAALMDVLTGKFKPQGKLPFALPKTQEAVTYNQSDVPGYPETKRPDGTTFVGGELYPFGFGLTY